MSISENIRQIRQNAGLTQEQFSIVAGVSPVAVSQWELGRSIPRMRSVDLIAKKFGITRNDILGEDDKISFVPNISGLQAFGINPVNTSRVRVLGYTHAGEPSSIEESDAFINMPENVVSNHPYSFALKVEGDCMSKVIPEDSYVLVDKRQEPRDGSIIVVRLIDSNETVMRRLRKGNTISILVADSYTPYPDLFWADDKQVELIGVVVYMQRSFEDA